MGARENGIFGGHPLGKKGFASQDFGSSTMTIKGMNESWKSKESQACCGERSGTLSFEEHASCDVDQTRDIVEDFNAATEHGFGDLVPLQMILR